MLEGWFTEDFTLAELKTLRARERIPEVRPANARFDGQFEIPTFDEVLRLLRSLDAQRVAAARRLGAPQPAADRRVSGDQAPHVFRSAGAVDGPRRCCRHWRVTGMKGRKAPVFIQSFEVGNLKRMRKKTRLPMVQLIEAAGAPYDFVAAEAIRARMRTSSRLGGSLDIAEYANAIGPSKTLVIPRKSADWLGSPTTLVRCPCRTSWRAPVDVPRGESLPACEPAQGCKPAAR